MIEYSNIGDLTEKQRIFCEMYCRVWDATKAAKEAGYSEKTAYSIGSENLRKPECAKYIQFIKDNALEFAGVSMLRNMQELAKIAYGSGADIRRTWESLEDWCDLPDDVKSTISEVTTSTRVIKSIGGDEESGASIVQAIETVKVKQYDKLKALEILNKMGGFNAPEKIEMNNVEISFDDSSNEE
ncbi:terminase small subunit [Brevundimonas sp.]|jgi:phage terminase small subunit|uniref:terminase small subunit n=1 Tax=Brevundimonas sp. TaxID=1871086 RepID=UPI0037845370